MVAGWLRDADTVDGDASLLAFSSRVSDSAWVASVWTARSDHVDEMTAVASESWGLVFWTQDGVQQAAVVGPETRTSTAPVPPGASFVGIQFAVGSSLRIANTSSLLDGGLELTDVTARGFWLDGRRWEAPCADDAEALVERLAHHGALLRDPVVEQVLRGDDSALSTRSVERRFRAAAGMSHGAVQQIKRARRAAVMLAGGAPTSDVVVGLGYYDEPHLSRLLRRYVGRTVRQLRTGSGGAIALDFAQRTTS